MSFSIHGLQVSRGIAIGRAVLVVSSRADVAHYFIDPAEVRSEINRVRAGRNAVAEEIHRLQLTLGDLESKDTQQELRAMLDVHLMLLQDETLIAGVKHWVKDRLYNAEWALTTQLEVIARQFDEMEDVYLRERKADLEQVVDRILRSMAGLNSPLEDAAPRGRKRARADAVAGTAQDADAQDTPLILIAHDLSPADMMQFKQGVFEGFVTDVGGKTSHTAIVARGMDIPAVVGARQCSQLVRQDDWIIVDGDAGIVIVDPPQSVLDEYAAQQRKARIERGLLGDLLYRPAITLDGQAVELLANIELPDDAALALKAGACGVGLFRSEFLFMGRHGGLPDEDEQYLAYKRAVEGMQGMPVTIRTIDVGADKPLDGAHERGARGPREDEHLNPALGLRAIRWSLADPVMFLTQLRAILRAAAHGPVNLLIPMLAHSSEIRQTLDLVAQARAQLDERRVPYGRIKLGAMIEIPAAALMVRMFLKYFDFLSVGTNDLIQYTLAIDRADEAVAYLYDPLHPAVLRLLAETIAASVDAGKPVSVCGEMAGDASMTRLLLGLGLRSFSMHPSQIPAVKQQVLLADASRLHLWAQQVLASDDPISQMGG